MANTRTRGANAEAISWEEAAGLPGPRKNNWLPLDALSDEEVYARGPQLQAMPNSRRPQAAPTRQYNPMSGHTMSQRVVAAIPMTQAQPQQRQNERAERAPREGVSLSKAQGKALAMSVGAMIALLALYVVVSAAVNWTQVKLDDFQYGRPRTSQMDAYVGHSEAEGSPSHFIAMNLNRRVTILQLPGGDSTKATAIVGPYLFGQGEDLTPVQMNVQDVNADGKPDLVVSVKSEQLLYLNDGASFKMATPEEQSAIFKALSARTAAPAKDVQAVSPEGQ
ncbi:MAG: hypothetical protein QOH93_2096 [Chloroflexia bacterium]|jgi:hypothetical protein|nr:hypothetical protein [Chloroflexia bacterium]